MVRTAAANKTACGNGSVSGSVVKGSEDIQVQVNQICKALKNTKAGYPDLDLIVFPEYSTQGLNTAIWTYDEMLLTIARALVAEPRVLILDEPTEGIQPSIIKNLARQINDLKLSKDLAIVVSEQVLSFTIDIADKMYVIESGRFVREDTRGNFDVEKITSCLSV